MRELFKRGSFIFWHFPVLWLPVMVADLLAFSLGALQTMASRAISRTLVDSSIFGARTSTDGLVSYWRPVVLIWPLFGISQFICIALYSAAFVALASFLLARLQDAGTSLASGFFLLKFSLRKFMIFNAKVFGLYLVVAVLSGLIQAIFITHPGWKMIKVRDLASLIGTLLLTGLAYFVVPISIRFLRNMRPSSLCVKHYGCGQAFGIVAILVAGILGLVVSRIESFYLPGKMSYLDVLAVQALGSIIEALPYIFLFIVISLIAFQTEEGVLSLDHQSMMAKAANVPLDG